jgi:hypothetical protein
MGWFMMDSISALEIAPSRTIVTVLSSETLTMVEGCDEGSFPASTMKSTLLEKIENISSGSFL